MEKFINEMNTYERRNSRLRNLRGIILIDKGEFAVRAKDFDEAEEFIFKAWEFAPYPKYGESVDYLYREVRASGDEVGDEVGIGTE